MVRPFDGLIRNEIGFYEVKDKPTQRELQEYYAAKYYQESKGSYEQEYSEAELRHIKGKTALRWSVIKNRFAQAGSMLDVGCGEGYALSFFAELGWQVRGLDYSRAGIESKNPDHAGKLVCGDLFELLANEINARQKYDVIWLQNVLEHVIDPVGLMSSLHELIKPEGVLVVTVPNDFSELQLQALDAGVVDTPYWVALPDHLSYFTAESLDAIGAATGWQGFKTLGDFPIDWFLFNGASNYIRDKPTGKSAHFARVQIENMILERSADDVANFYSALAKLGMGRDLTAFFTAD